MTFQASNLVSKPLDQFLLMLGNLLLMLDNLLLILDNLLLILDNLLLILDNLQKRYYNGCAFFFGYLWDLEYLHLFCL